MGLRGQLHFPAALPHKKVTRYSLDRILIRFQSTSGCCGGKINILYFQESVVESIAQVLYLLSYPYF
jgi:hypothetical protein